MTRALREKLAQLELPPDADLGATPSRSMHTSGPSEPGTSERATIALPTPRHPRTWSHASGQMLWLAKPSRPLLLRFRLTHTGISTL